MGLNKKILTLCFISLFFQACVENSTWIQVAKKRDQSASPDIHGDNLYQLHSLLRMPDSEMTNTFERFSVPSFSGDGKRLFVGAHTEWYGGYSEAGSIFVFDYNESTDSWTQTGLLRHPSPVNYHKLGLSITSSIDGKTVFAAGEFTRAVLVFKESAGVWSLHQTIELAVPLAGFGSFTRVSNDNSILVINGTLSDETLTAQGAVFVYKLNTSTGMYEFLQKIVELDNLSTTNRFGTSLTATSDMSLLAIGSPRETITNLIQGRVYLYEWNPSSQMFQRTQALERATTHDNLNFGRFVSYSDSGKYLTVAHQEVVNGFIQGGLSVYERGTDGTYALLQELTPASEIVNPSGATNWALRSKFNSEASQLFVSGTNCYVELSTKGCVDIYKRENGAFVHHDRITPRYVSSASTFGQNLELSSNNRFLAVGIPGLTLRKAGNGTQYSSSGGLAVYKMRSAPQEDGAETLQVNRHLPARKNDLLVFSPLSANVTTFENAGVTSLFTNFTPATLLGENVSSVANSSSLQIQSSVLDTPLTIAFSYYATAATNSAVFASNEQFEIRLANSNQFEVRLFDSGRVTNATWVSDPAAFQLNRWHNIMVSFSWDLSKTPKVYLQGDQLYLYRTGAGTPVLNPMPETVSFGSYLGTNTHPGYIKNVAIWQGETSADEAFAMKKFYEP
jgi:hypothetical protein